MFERDCIVCKTGIGAGRLIDGVIRKEKLLIEAPVNGGRNYNGPKVAKFLVG